MGVVGEVLRLFAAVLLIPACLCLLWPPAAGDPRATIVATRCGGGDVTPYTNYPVSLINFISMAADLYSQVAAHGYGTATSGQEPNEWFGLAQCFSDLSSADCDVCFGQGRAKLATCYNESQARVYADGCFIRASNFSFFDQIIEPNDTSICSNSSSGSGDRSFSVNVVKAVKSVALKARQSNGFAVGRSMDSGNAAYALAQCWRNLNGSLCGSCLDAAAHSVVSCAPAAEGRALFTGCYIRYSSSLFWNINATNAADSGRGRTTVWIVLGCIFGALLIIVVILGIFFLRKRRARHVDSYLNVRGGLPERVILSSLSFKYEHLKRATKNFSVSNKLGQGKYGTVYKAVLSYNKEVAVKRLFLNVSEHADLFCNEIQLLSHLRHKNLARMLGFSTDGPERLLVHEYYPNRSLDLFLYDASGNKILDWQERVDIILGVAEGLCYLHEECGTRIIHRDIKASNILLDDKYMPKITDFGLGRALDTDGTHLTTEVAGTLGYMAPEYIVHGHLTEKADVYSFGVLVIEILTGRRCNASMGTRTGHLLLQQVWKLFTTDAVERFVDQRIYQDNIRAELTRTTQIGLLCVQANPGDRPTMRRVVELLRSGTPEVHMRLDSPPFIDAETLGPENSQLSQLRSLMESFMRGR